MSKPALLSRVPLRARERVAVYIDGFNMYHALCDLNKDSLKWVNHRKLADLMISKQSQKIVRVCYFSAYAEQYQNTTQVHKLLRHRAYVAALESKGVECIMGNFADRTRTYKGGTTFRASWRGHEEKQTDVSLACHVLNDAHLDVYDRALIVCLDTDQLPTYEMVKRLFPHKQLVCVAPPSRSHHGDLQAAADAIASIKASQVKRALFGPVVRSGGAVVARRPAAYRP